jgi:hypothetical protein
MSIPNLKRVKVSSEQELKSWLSKKSNQKQSVMLVTCNKKSKDKHISHEQVDDALTAYGWIATRRYTLNGNLLGHVIHKELDLGS